MIVGSLSRQGVPIVELSVAGRTWRALIDTGFGGDLELPYALGPYVNARYLCVTESRLAAGVTVEEESYTVEVPFDGEIVKGEATFVDADEILVGTRLLRNHRLEIDFPAGTVKLERVATSG